MTSKELREIARVALAKELQTDPIDAPRVHAVLAVCTMPMDVDEQREFYGLVNEQSNSGGAGAMNSTGPTFAQQHRDA